MKGLIMITVCICFMGGFLGGLFVWNDIEKRLAKIEKRA